jgi:hypothetical protein
MDSIGFTLENYDPIGRFRQSANGESLDVSGPLPDGRVLQGPQDLVAYVTEGRAFMRSLSKKLFIHAVGRKPELEDELALESLLRRLPGQETTLKELILGIVEMNAFRMKP